MSMNPWSELIATYEAQRDHMRQLRSECLAVVHEVHRSVSAVSQSDHRGALTLDPEVRWDGSFWSQPVRMTLDDDFALTLDLGVAIRGDAYEVRVSGPEQRGTWPLPRPRDGARALDPVAFEAKLEGARRLFFDVARAELRSAVARPRKEPLSP